MRIPEHYEDKLINLHSALLEFGLEVKKINNTSSNVGITAELALLCLIERLGGKIEIL